MYLTWIGWGGTVPWLPGSPPPGHNPMGVVLSEVHSALVIILDLLAIKLTNCCHPTFTMEYDFQTGILELAYHVRLVKLSCSTTIQYNDISGSHLGQCLDVLIFSSWRPIQLRHYNVVSFRNSHCKLFKLKYIKSQNYFSVCKHFIFEKCTNQLNKQSLAVLSGRHVYL